VSNRSLSIPIRKGVLSLSSFSKRIDLSIEEKKAMVESVKKYFLNERDMDLGDLAASLILNFFIEEIGPVCYNRGVDDAYKCMNERIEDLMALQILKK